MLAFEALIKQAIRLQKMCLDLLTPPFNYKRSHLRCQTPDHKMKLNLALASRLSREVDFHARSRFARSTPPEGK